MIKNIIFDLGNVILKDKPYVVLDKMQLDKKQYNTIKNNFFSNWEELDRGIVTLEEHLYKSKIEFEIDDKIKYQLENYYKFRPFNIDVVNIAKQLKKNNYKVYILSNNNKEAMKYLINLPLFKDIDGWVASCDYQTLKPDEKLYKILFEKYNLKPEECFFIDDKEENINTGKMLGMNGYVFDYNNHGILGLVNEFEKNNIQIEK